jgi:hypothetical protein
MAGVTERLTQPPDHSTSLGFSLHVSPVNLNGIYLNKRKHKRSLRRKIQRVVAACAMNVTTQRTSSGCFRRYVTARASSGKCSPHRPVVVRTLSMPRNSTNEVIRFQRKSP